MGIGRDGLHGWKQTHVVMKGSDGWDERGLADWTYGERSQQAQDELRSW